MRRHVEQAGQRLAGLLDPFLALQKLTEKREAERMEKRAGITDHLKDEGVFSPLRKAGIAWLGELEPKGMVLPLSLRAGFEEVGDVNLAGAHPALCFWEDEKFPGVYADPLMVTLDHFEFEIEGWVEDRDAGGESDGVAPVFGWDAPMKARLAVAKDELDDGYTIALPDAGADAPLKGEPHKTRFVDYLRIAFCWGGFPRWEWQAKRPEKELKFLTEGLLPF